MTERVGDDGAGARVLDGDDMTAYVGLDLRVLKGEVGVGSEFTVFEDKIVGVAEWLSLHDFAVDETETVAVPGKILTIDDRVVDSDILGVPESILGVEDRIAYDDILAVLERVVAIESQIVDLDIAAMHEDIVALVDLNILERDILAVPKSLGSMERLDILETESVHVAEHLWGLDDGIRHDHVAGVPDGSACSRGEMTVGNRDIITFPERVLALETAVGDGDIAAFLERTLAEMYGDILELNVVLDIERAFAFKFLILD